MIAVIVLAGYALLALYEFIPLYRQKLWQDFWVNAAIGGLSLVTALLLCFKVGIPSPAVPIRTFITAIFGK